MNLRGGDRHTANYGPQGQGKNSKRAKKDNERRVMNARSPEVPRTKKDGTEDAPPLVNTIASLAGTDLHTVDGVGGDLIFQRMPDRVVKGAKRLREGKIQNSCTTATS